MGVINKGLWYIVVLMALGLGMSAAAALYFRGRVSTTAAELKAAQSDLRGLQSEVAQIRDAQRKAVLVDVKQSDVRAKHAQAVRAVRAKIRKEATNANDSHPASAAELHRLRLLIESANAGIRTARELP